MILVAEFHRLSSVGEDVHALCRECDTVLGAVLGHAEQIVKHAVDTIDTQRRAGSQVADNDSITVISNDKTGISDIFIFCDVIHPIGNGRNVILIYWCPVNVFTRLF